MKNRDKRMSYPRFLIPCFCLRLHRYARRLPGDRHSAAMDRQDQVLAEVEVDANPKAVRIKSRCDDETVQRGPNAVAQ